VTATGLVPTPHITGNDVALIAPRAKVADWPIHTPHDVARHTLLRHVTVPEAWLRWSETHGVQGSIDRWPARSSTSSRP
jgi:hypothetical protein